MFRVDFKNIENKDLHWCFSFCRLMKRVFRLAIFDRQNVEEMFLFLRCRRFSPIILFTFCFFPCVFWETGKLSLAKRFVRFSDRQLFKKPYFQINEKLAFMVRRIFEYFQGSKRSGARNWSNYWPPTSSSSNSIHLWPFERRSWTFFK